jgi:hypothetical protein
MEDIGFNWGRPHSNLRLKAPSEWPADIVSLQHLSVIITLCIMFYVCKNFKLSTTKYMRGKEYSI